MAEIKLQLLNKYIPLIEESLSRFNLSLNESEKISQSVKKLSDYYIENPKLTTPWKESFTQIAYLAYYFPLNFLRNYSMFQSISKTYGDLSYHSLIDIGSGLGSLSASLPNEWGVEKVYNVEQSGIAIDLHKELFVEENKKHLWKKSIENSSVENSLLSFSYSLTENLDIEKYLDISEDILIIEPSTKGDFRYLESVRTLFLEKKYHILAPCTHREGCPLSTGKSDWCHFSYAQELPEYIQEIERYLPWQHRALSYSYLFVSKKKKSKVEGLTRVVGNLLKEKAKEKQMICRGDKREFLSSLKKNPYHLSLDRGDLIDIDDYEEKGNELRLHPNSKIVKR